jgi:hypothetical protein
MVCLSCGRARRRGAAIVALTMATILMSAQSVTVLGFLEVIHP